MSDPAAQPRRWTGRAIIAISIIHTVFAFLAFGTAFQKMLAAGLYDSIGADPMLAASAWFFFAGMFMASTGIAVDMLEKYGSGNRMRLLGIFLLLVTILGIVMMPVSGFWLMFVPTIAMIMNREKDQKRSD